ncbi:vacuolar protein sorting-associated protein 51 homolog isoform X1 [Rhododendron vialii]|uniref:vacuolar protein sorting-associated protein 51 homolog isoform X1 n=2 Tax=Rhododendron vialii TaxID=182163 RepID=UPI0026603F53|nr:vacuolar protein sorting-associated protein 51 homolog isoform X1 [Rhododendron vialii]
MEVDGGAPLDDKAKRMRDLLSSFYSADPPPSMPSNTSSRYATLDTINTTSFDAEQYMNLLVQKSNLENLLQRHVEMAAEIKNLDTDLQMLVYENYNKFISATDTIKRMKNNIVGMESNMEQLLEKIISVQSRSDGVNTSLFEKREHIEKLHRTRNLLRKVQFIYDLPSRLGKCIKSEAYADAVKYYTGAMPIFKAYGNTSFQDCKRASEEAISIIKKNLQGKLFSDTESIQARAEAAMLLKQLDFPVDSLKAKLLEKLEQSIDDLRPESRDISNASVDCDEPSKQEIFIDSVPSTAHQASTHEFVEALRAYRVIFPDSEQQLIKLAQNLVTKNFEVTQQQIRRQIRSVDLLGMLQAIWTDVLLMDEVLPEAALSAFSIEAAHVAVKQYIDSRFSHLLLTISDALTKVQCRPKEGVEEEYTLESALGASKKAVTEGSMDVLQDFRQLLDDDLGLLVKLRALLNDWVQEGFQDFFRKLDNHFLLLSGKINSTGQDQGLTEGTQKEKIISGLLVVLAQLSVFIEQSAIPRITEEIAASFSAGGARGYEYGPAFVPAEICRIFRSAGEKFLHLYINMRTQKISVLLRKRFTTPNWVKHKEPREVHMFVDLFLQELEAIGTEVKQILPQGIHRKHHRTDSNGSTTSSRSNPLRDDRIIRSNTQRGRSQLLETHLAKLFKQKMEIFTKVEHTQESVVTTIVKFCLKSLQEFVRLQTFNRSGFQQIQLDIQFLRTTLKETAEDEAAIDFLLDEVIVAAAERCLDPIPLEPPILDKLIQAKLAKNSEQSPASSSLHGFSSP